jgi:ubiquinone/menaquinone biosynthesis C-methylase UbiE
MSDQSIYQQVIEANIALHSKMADAYSTCEPHFRPENVEQVETKLKHIFDEVKATAMLDLGCGTGFMIHIAKKYLQHIDGVDVTQAMMDKVDRSGPCTIELHNHDTGTFPAKEGFYDVVTGYSFLHHLYDIAPTINTAYKALKPGGKFYADLDPNFYYWEQINQLDRNGSYPAVIKREIEMVTYKDEDIENNFGVSKDVFNNAEFGKNIQGGFKEEQLRAALGQAGFTKVDVFYYWFLGQAGIVNDESIPDKAQRLQKAAMVNETLQGILPVSRCLYKYLGFIATK